MNVKKASIVYINNEYVRGKELDITQLFNIEDVSDIARQKQNEIQTNIEMINSFMDEYGKDNEPDKDLGLHCFNPYLCDFWNYCTRDLPKPNVFDVGECGNQKRLKSIVKEKFHLRIWKMKSSTQNT